MPERGTPSGLFINFQAAVIQALPRNLSDEDLQYWAENGEGLARTLEAALTGRFEQQPQPEADLSARPSHKDICIKFEVGGRRYEAVGFLKFGETSVTGDEMLARTDMAGTVVDEDDYLFICERRWELPEILDLYNLVTKYRPGSDNRAIFYLRLLGREWWQNSLRLDYQWGRVDLVLRRCT